MNTELIPFPGDYKPKMTEKADPVELLAAALGRLAHTNPELARPAVSVIEAVREFLKAKARAGRSDRYLRTLRVTLASFARGREHVSLSDVTVPDLESWLDSHGWKCRTRRGYLNDVRTLYRWAGRRGWTKENPAAAVELPDLPPKSISLHSPGEVKAVLDFARTYNLNICRVLALRYFAGLRSAEADRLAEADIHREFVEVTAAKSKTRQRRLITISLNLRAWLALGGHVPLSDVNNTMRWFTAALKKQTGIAWPPNVTRHSFCSYHLAFHESPGRTALVAGHSEAMLFAHYRELASKEDAASFWAVLPA